MAYSQATLVSRIRRELNDAPWFDTCTEVMDVSETDLSVADTTYWAIGDIVEFQGLDASSVVQNEQCLVTALFDATTLTVRRGHNDTTPATHATGASIAKNPLFQKIQIEKAIEGALQSMWPTAYYPEAKLVTPVAGTKWYNGYVGWMDIIQAVQMSTDSSSVPKFYGGRRGSYPVTLIQNMPVLSFAAGNALYIPYHFNDTNTISVVGARLMDDTIATGSYTYLDDGLAVEAVVYLAAADLVTSTDVPRTVDQDNTMHDQTVAPLARAQLGDELRRLGSMKKQQYAQELHRRAPRMPVWHGVR